MPVLMMLKASGFSQANSVKVEQCGRVRCAIWLEKKTCVCHCTLCANVCAHLLTPCLPGRKFLMLCRCLELNGFHLSHEELKPAVLAALIAVERQLDASAVHAIFFAVQSPHVYPATTVPMLK
jgi:hypothetical protein